MKSYVIRTGTICYWKDRFPEMGQPGLTSGKNYGRKIDKNNIGTEPQDTIHKKRTKWTDIKQIKQSINS